MDCKAQKLTYLGFHTDNYENSNSQIKKKNVIGFLLFGIFLSLLPKISYSVVLILDFKRKRSLLIERNVGNGGTFH